MTIRNTFVRLRDNLLGLTEPTRFDIRPNRLIIRRRTWANRQVGGTFRPDSAEVGNDGGTYTAVDGDTWGSISTLAYGDSSFAKALRTANKAPEVPVAGVEYAIPAYLTVDAPVPQRFAIVHVSDRDIASSGGRYAAGDLRVKGISPAYYDDEGKQQGGFTPLQLRPPGRPGSELVYVIEGTEAGEYIVVQSHTEDPFGYDLVIRRTRVTP